MTLSDIVGAIFSGILISIKRVLGYNRTMKTIDRKAYDIYTEEEYSLLVEMYSNPLFARLPDTLFWSDIRSGRNKHGRENSVLTNTERSLANFYLIWKEEDENKKH